MAFEISSCMTISGHARRSTCRNASLRRISGSTWTIFIRRSATASAASPSPRPVKPSLSVVVARTFTRPGSTPIASASFARIASRSGAILGSSPTSTQSAFASSKPASRTWA